MKFEPTWLLPALFAAALFAGAGCNKPTEDDCRKALVNIRTLLGTEHLSQADQTIEGEVRRCRGGSKRASVACAIKATTVAELRECKLIDVPAAPGEPAASKDAAPAPTEPAPPAPTAPVAPDPSAPVPAAPPPTAPAPQ
jgi:hypothetical protein